MALAKKYIKYIKNLVQIIIMICFAEANAQNIISISAMCYNLKTKEFVSNITVGARICGTGRGECIFLYTDSYPGTECGIGYMFNRTDYDSTYRTIGNKGGYGWEISTKSEIMPERVYVGLYQGVGERDYEIYFYKKSNGKLNYRDYYLKLSAHNATELLKFIVGKGNEYKLFNKL